MKKIVALLIIIGILPMITLPLGFFYTISPTGNSNENVYIEIKKGDTAYSIGERLKDKNIIRSSRLFTFLARYLKYDKKLPIGFYNINRSMNTIEVLKYINEGNQVLTKFTVIEGKNIYDIADYLDSLDIVSRENFLSSAHSQKILDKYNIKASSVEGYLYPSTYYIAKGNSSDYIVETMINSLFDAFPKNYLQDSAKKMGYTLHELLTMASIVEKEMGSRDDPRMISSVYYNRLNKNMRLQADPTTIYSMVLENKKAIPKPNIKRADLFKVHPYNTYKMTGLPPGPIANSGKKAIEASINPAKTDYFFFVADGTGKHAFATDYNTHLKNIDKYIFGK